MDEAAKQRLRALLHKNRRRLLIPAAVEAWAVFGIAASPLSHDRQVELLARLRGWTATDFMPAGDLALLIDDCIGSTSIVTIIDWHADEHPALLVSGHALRRPEGDLRRIYPNGFILIAGPSALIVDLEEEPGKTEVRWLGERRSLPTR